MKMGFDDESNVQLNAMLLQQAGLISAAPCRLEELESWVQRRYWNVVGRVTTSATARLRQLLDDDDDDDLFCLCIISEAWSWFIT